MKIEVKRLHKGSNSVIGELTIDGVWECYTLEDYVGNETIKKSIQQYLNQNDIQNFIFYGPAGTGKTTLAKLIVNNLDCDYLYINASDERGIETIRDKVQGFASVASFKSLKVVILDEADFLTIQAQASLRNIIETYSRTTRFILTCNYVERIIDPLQSRCQVLKIIPPSKQEIAKDTRRGKGNILILSTDVASALAMNCNVTTSSPSLSVCSLFVLSKPPQSI